MRFVAASIAVHVLVMWLLVRGEHRAGAPHVPAAPDTRALASPEPIEIEMLAPSPEGGGSPAASRAQMTNASSARTTSAARRVRTRDAWEGLTIRNESAGESRAGGGSGNGSGRGHGTGRGNGIGFGNGGGVQIARGVPAPPVPVVSKARPAKLIWPTRNREVEDEADLFIARVTVDEDGFVVGARMVKTRPGSRGEQAADAIWRFRYLPALDERGVPTRSTFEQPFQIR